MMKYVSASEFKAKCLQLMAEVQAGGEAVTVTKRGKPLAVVTPPVEPAAKPLPSAFGMLKSDKYRFDLDPEEGVDPDWEKKWEAKWDERGYPAPSSDR